MRYRRMWMLIALTGVTAGAYGQWVNHPSPGTPRTKDGKPNLTAPAPRASNGKPDLSGVWQAQASPIPELLRLLPGGGNGLGEDIPTKYFINIFADFNPGEEPLQPSAAGSQPREYTLRRFRKDDPGINCLPTGVPAVDTIPTPFKIVQTPGLIMMLVESDTTFRQIFTDGRKFPEDPTPSWMGYSVGKWDGDVLVVETIGFNDRGWLDAVGHMHSDALRVTERFHRVNFGRMEVQLTLDDPKTFTKPVTVKFNEVLFPDTDLIESYCTENERDLAHSGVR